jgi:hypothetical protein
MHKSEIALCDPFNTQLQHLAALARVPGFKAHAWHRALDLSKDPTKLWLGLPDALTAVMRSESAHQSPEKPR